VRKAPSAPGTRGAAHRNPAGSNLPDPKGTSSIRSIATTSPGWVPRTTIGPTMGAGGCPWQAGVNGVGTALISSTSRHRVPRPCNSSPESTVIGGGVCVLTEKRSSVLFVLIVPLAMHCRGWAE
jgi:hypothetical protein